VRAAEDEPGVWRNDRNPEGSNEFRSLPSRALCSVSFCAWLEREPTKRTLEGRDAHGGPLRARPTQSAKSRERWSFHDTEDPLVRFLRDRRIKIGTVRAMKISGGSPKEWDALVVCGGVGGEGTLLANLGFRSKLWINANAAVIRGARNLRFAPESHWRPI